MAAVGSLVPLDGVGSLADTANIVQSISPAWEEPKVIIRVALPNDQSTAIQTPHSMTTGEIFKMVCERRGLDESTHIMKIVFQDTTDTEAVFDRKLSEYDLWKSIVIVQNFDSLSPLDPTIRLPARRKSTINSPGSKGISVRQNSSIFPRAIATVNESSQASSDVDDDSSSTYVPTLAKKVSQMWRLRERSKTSNNMSNSNINISRTNEPKSACSNSDLFASPNGASTPATITPIKTSPSSATIRTSNSTAGVGIGTGGRMIADFFEGAVTQMRGRSISRRSGASILDFNGSEISSGKGSPDQSGGEEIRSLTGGNASPTSTITRNRGGDDIRAVTKRALQGPTDSNLAGMNILRFRSLSGSGTLRRSPNRRRVQSSDVTLHIYTVAPETLPLDFKLHSIDIRLLDGRTTTVIVGDDVTAESVLEYVCKMHELDFSIYALETTTNQTAVELDKTIGFFVSKDNVKELAVVIKPKAYSTLCVSENDKDVLILQVSNGNIKILAATDEKLIEQITDTINLAAQLSLSTSNHEPEYDYDFLDVFLMTYRSFMKPTELFNQIVARFSAELPSVPTEEDIEFYNKNKVPTQHRAVQAIGIWVESYWHDFTFNGELKVELDEFLDFLATSETFLEAAEVIKNTRDEQMEIYDRMFNEQRLAMQKSKTMQSIFATDKPPQSTEIAQQLCIYDFKLFIQIHSIEYLNQIWRKKDEEDSSTPNLDFFIARFDLESYWVATEICTTKDLKQRTATLARFIDTAKYCLDHNNLFSMFALISGLGIRPVERLKKTWKGLSDDTRSKHEELLKMCDPSRNMKNYRDKLAQAKAPIVPFLPIYLKDLTFLNDGNESRVHGLINFDKLSMMSSRVKEIGEGRKSGYNFAVNKVLQNYLKKPPTERDLKKLKEMSLELEPDK